MKKAYMKPEIAFEDFALTINIAGGCGLMVNNPTKGTCGIPGSGGETLFGDFNTTGCTFNWINANGSDSFGDGFCYHNPGESYFLFNS